LCLAGLTFEATLSADAAGIAPPASPRLLWRPAAAVASTTSPFICGALPSPDASLQVIAAVWRSLAMVVAEIASFGGSPAMAAGKKTPSPSMRQWEGGREEAKLVYSMLSFRLHIQVKSTWWLPKQWAWQDLKTTGKTKGRRFLINCYTHAAWGVVVWPQRFTYTG
jgi:hypothetical protein